MLATIWGISGSFNIIKFNVINFITNDSKVSADWGLWDQLYPESTTYVILSYPQALEDFSLTIPIL